MKLPHSRSQSLQTLSQLMNASWVDNLTRLVLLQINLYSFQSNLFAAITVSWEFLSTGGAIPHISIQVEIAYDEICSNTFSRVWKTTCNSGARKKIRQHTQVHHNHSFLFGFSFMIMAFSCHWYSNHGQASMVIFITFESWLMIHDLAWITAFHPWSTMKQEYLSMIKESFSARLTHKSWMNHGWKAMACNPGQ